MLFMSFVVDEFQLTDMQSRPFSFELQIEFDESGMCCDWLVVQQFMLQIILF